MQFNACTCNISRLGQCKRMADCPMVTGHSVGLEFSSGPDSRQTSVSCDNSSNNFTVAPLRLV